MNRIYLSPPDIGSSERGYVKEAFDTNWIAPVGPHLDAFEEAVEESLGGLPCVAVNSGTAAIHLALILANVGVGDEVICSSLTFIASANPILYQGAKPIFVDSERDSWNMDPVLLGEVLRAKAKCGALPKAAIVVDLYGQAADYQKICGICEEYGVVLIEDAAEALGASCRERSAGSFGEFGVFSFNGNKIITTSGGGMLICHDRKMADKARFLATQARDSAIHYEHSQCGFNYRMSNVLAGIGRGQFEDLVKKVKARRRNFEYYQSALKALPFIFMPEASWGQSNRWLTCLTLHEGLNVTPHQICEAMSQQNIECRPVWKPLHLQPLFAETERHTNGVSEDLFSRGLCLPSGSSMTREQLARVCEALGTAVETCLNLAPHRHGRPQMTAVC